MFKNKKTRTQFDGVSARAPRVVRVEVERRFLRHAYLFVLWMAIAAAFVTLGFGLLYGRKASAESALFPRICLGGWSNPEHASGVPDIAEATGTDFTSTNSASVGTSLADLYCGDFAGDIPADTKPTAIQIDISWTVRFNPEQPLISATPADLASSTDEALQSEPDTAGLSTPSPSPTEPLAPEESAQETRESEPSVSPQDAPEVLPETTPESAPDEPAPEAPSESAPQTDAPQSFLWRVLGFKFAMAEELSTSTPRYEDAILEVAYTLDGTAWNTLGSVTAFNVAQHRFVIPLETISTWEDVEKIQIRIRRLSSLSDISTVYVDGMTLSVSYLPVSAEATSTPYALTDQASVPESELPKVIIHAEHKDGSTNIAFYRKCPARSCEGYGTALQPVYVFTEETVGHGAKPFLDYWQPPEPNDYVAVEYVNDRQQFTCSDKSLGACVRDPHFIKEIRFTIAATSSEVESAEVKGAGATIDATSTP